MEVLLMRQAVEYRVVNRMARAYMHARSLQHFLPYIYASFARQIRQKHHNKENEETKKTKKRRTKKVSIALFAQQIVNKATQTCFISAIPSR